MRCDHRFKLVGYRDSTGEPPQPYKDAVLVCLRCARESLVGVDEKAPAPLVERVAPQDFDDPRTRDDT